MLSFTKKIRKNNFHFPYFNTKQLIFYIAVAWAVVYLHRGNAADMRNGEEEMRLSHKHRRKAVITL